MSNMTNGEYRKSRGTNRPFSSSEEQAKAIWAQTIRQEKFHYNRKPTPSPEAAPKG